MATSLFVTSLEPSAGKTLVVLSLVDHLAATAGRVGYLRPVVPLPDDRRADLVRSRLRPRGGDGRIEVDDVVELVTAADLADLVAEDRVDELVAQALEAYHDLLARCDVVVVDGADHTGVVGTRDLDLDATLIGDLGTPVLAVVKGAERRASAILDAVGLAHDRIADIGATHLGTVVNRVAADARAEVEEGIASSQVPVQLVPEDRLLAVPSTAEVFAALGAVPVELHGAATVDDDRAVAGVKVGAMSLPNLVDRIPDGMLLLTPGDRADIVMAALVQDVAPGLPSVAGILLTGGIALDERMQDVLRSIGSSAPVAAVATGTYDTADAVSEVPSAIAPHHTRKVARALELGQQHLDLPTLTGALATTRVERVTPRMFERRLVERAAADRRHIVLPEGTDERILQAARILVDRDVVDLTLLGAPAAVRERAEQLGVDVSDIPVLDPTSDERLEPFALRYQQLRAHKGVSLDQARDRMSDVSYFGTMMVHEGEADGMVSGAAHTTAHTIRPAFEFIRTRPGVDVVSSVFLMCLADRVLVYGDCAVIPNPTSDELADIAVASAGTAATFGIEPRVAMLSYSTGASGSGSDVERVVQATALAQERAPELLLDGPLQYDAAIDPSTAAKKAPDSKVAGRATVFVFPDLDTGNTTYKAVQRSAGAVAIGPVLQGLNAPVNDLSRGCLVPDVVNTVAITAIQAQVADARGAGSGA